MHPSLNQTFKFVDEDKKVLTSSVGTVLSDLANLLSLKITAKELNTISQQLIDIYKSQQPVKLSEFTQKLLSILVERGHPITLDAILGGFDKTSTVPKLSFDAHDLVRTHKLNLDLQFSQRIVDNTRTLLQYFPSDRAGQVDIRNLRPAIKLLLGRSRWTRKCAELMDLVVEQARAVALEEAKGRPSVTLNLFP